MVDVNIAIKKVKSTDFDKKTIEYSLNQNENNRLIDYKL